MGRLCIRCRKRRDRRAHTVAALLAAGIVAAAFSAQASLYGLNDIVTDDNANLVDLGFPAATTVDPNLINPWGVSFGATTPFWISDNGTGLTSLYRANGLQVSPPSPVTIAAPEGAPPEFVAAPTGQVNNPTSGFVVTQGTKSAPALFIFATEDGTISGWNPSVNPTSSVRVIDSSPSGAVYKGLVLANTSTGTALFAANFNSGMIEEYNSGFGFVKSFTDPSPPPVPVGTPAGQNWAPFNVQLINGQLYVTYALQDAAKHDDVAGAGNGFVDVFDLNGLLVQRLINTGPGDPLDSPWGLAIAPAGFGSFANDLLVGNFGNGEINAFDPSSGAFLGMLEGSNGMPIAIPGLWDITIGNGGVAVDPNAVYFTAGLPNFSMPDLGFEQEGLFGNLTVIPEPGSLLLLNVGLVGLLWFSRRRRLRGDEVIGSASSSGELLAGFSQAKALVYSRSIGSAARAVPTNAGATRRSAVNISG